MTHTEVALTEYFPSTDFFLAVTENLKAIRHFDRQSIVICNCNSHSCPVDGDCAYYLINYRIVSSLSPLHTAAKMSVRSFFKRPNSCDTVNKGEKRGSNALEDERQTD